MDSTLNHNFLDDYLTGKDVPVTFRVNYYGQIREVTVDAPECIVPLGDILVRLDKLFTLQRKRSGRLYKFFNGSVPLWEVETEIKKLKEILNQVSFGWHKSQL